MEMIDGSAPAQHAGVTTRRMEAEDWEAVRAILLEGIATGQATFETESPDWETWDRGHRSDCRIVAQFEGRVVGWAALSPVSGRCVHGGVAEVSVYVADPARGQGIGRHLLRGLVKASERAGIWT